MMSDLNLTPRTVPADVATIIEDLAKRLGTKPLPMKVAADTPKPASLPYKDAELPELPLNDVARVIEIDGPEVDPDEDVPF